MWGLRRTSRPRPPQPTARLRLEALDLRLPPSSLFDPTADPLVPASEKSDGGQVQAADPGSPESSPSVTAADQPPAGNPPPAGDPPPTGDQPPADDQPPGTQTSVYTVGPEAPANTPPKIINFQGVAVVGGLWRFTGDVVDEAPGGLTVEFSGQPASLENKSTTTDANGHFDKSFLMKRDGTDDGLAEAQTTDRAGLESNLACWNIHPS